MLSRKELPLTMLLIAVCVGIYAGTLFIEDWDGGYYSADSIWEGTYWAYITSCFVHFDILHILFNLYWLFMLGQLIETEIGSFKMILIVFLSCIVTSGFQFLFTEDTGIGFSGVLYSFFGFMWASKNHFPLFKRFLTKQLFKAVLAWLVLCWMLTIAEIWSIGNIAHLSGLLFGFLLAKIFFARRFRIAAVSLLIVAIAISVIPVFWYPTSITWLSIKAYSAYESEENEKAIGYLTRAIDMNSEYAWAYYLRGFAYANMKQEKLSKGDWKRACDLDPSLFEEE